MSPAAGRPASVTLHAFAPSAAEVPLLQERLRQLGSDAPVRTSPMVSAPGGLHGQSLLWSWTADGIEALGGFAAACHELHLALLVGIARWVPLETVLGVLAAAGLRPRAAARLEIGGHRGVELAMTRDEVPEPSLALALLELVTWSAPWHRGRQQPLRLAVEGATPHDLRDHPHASDIRAVWQASPAALRLASPEIVLVGEPGDQDAHPTVRDIRSTDGTPRVERVPTSGDEALRRPTLAAEPLLLATRGMRPETAFGRSGSSASVVAILQQLAAGTPVDLPEAVRRQLAPEVVAAAESPDLGAAGAVHQLRARTRLRWSVVRHHSAIGLAVSLEARTSRAVVPRPRLSLCLDASAAEQPAAIDAAIQQLAAQRRRPDEVVLATAEGAGRAAAVAPLAARLRAALGVEVGVVGTHDAARGTTGDLVVVAPLDAQLATDALADLELAHRLWAPTVSVVPVEFVLDDGEGLHRSATEHDEGLGVPATIGVLAVAGRELRAHWRAEELTLDRREGFVADAVRRGAMVHTMPSVRAVFRGTPATLQGAHHLDVGARTLLVGDRAGP